jgi:hypothetical protein
MRLLPTTIAALAAVALLPGAASATAPWSAPAPIPGATGAPNQTVFTRAGHGFLLSPQLPGPGLGPFQLARIAADGSFTTRRSLSFVASELATYGNDRIVVAGRTLATSGPYVGTIDDSSEVAVRSGTPADLGPTRIVPGTKGRQIFAMASNRDGLVALVVGSLRTRSVLLRRPGSSTFAEKLRIRVSSNPRGATVAVGEAGDVLVVYEDGHVVRARHIGRHGSVGPLHRLGAGVQSELRALVTGSGRLEVAWKSQRVNEGSAGTPAIVSFATAAPGRGFSAARVIASVGEAGAGRYVGAPAVRLVADGDEALLAYTGFDGTNYTVEARQVTGGRPAPAQRLSPAGVDAVLGDAAVGPKGAQIVAWRSGVAGADANLLPNGQPAHTPVLANVRGAGAAAFGAAEAISPADADVAYAPSAAIDPVSGRAIVAYGTHVPAVVQIASRPPS